MGGEKCSAVCSGFDLGGALDGDAEGVGLDLEEGVAACEAAGGAEELDAGAVAAHGVDDFADAVGDAFEDGAGEVFAGGCEGEAGEGCAGVGVPVGRAEAGEGGGEGRAGGVGDAGGELAELGGVLGEAE